jgi:4'-phosphopantetheinyl transferase
MLHVFLGEGNARELLTYAVERIWGLRSLPEISLHPGGKPVFSDYPDLHFNYSHSGNLVLCTLSDRPVGVDIELVRPRRETLPAYVFQGEAYQRYLELGGDWNAFYTLWTQVESIIKYTGEGLKAWRRAQVPAECVISRFSGEGWKGSVCAHEYTEDLFRI